MSKLKGHFRECCVALFLNPAQYDAQWLHKALTGLRTNDSILIEIMCTRTNLQIREIKEYYRSGKKNWDTSINKICKNIPTFFYKNPGANLVAGAKFN